MSERIQPRAKTYETPTPGGVDSQPDSRHSQTLDVSAAAESTAVNRDSGPTDEIRQLLIDQDQARIANAAFRLERWRSPRAIPGIRGGSLRDRLARYAALRYAIVNSLEVSTEPQADTEALDPDGLRADDVPGPYLSSRVPIGINDDSTPIY